MKKKEKLSILILFSLSLSAILTNVLGQTTYTCEVNVGDEFIFTVTTVNALFVMSGASVGDKRKINITDITVETDYFTIDYDDWDMISKGESFNATADHSIWDDIYKDPSDPFMYIDLFVLTPVSDYLAAFAGANSNTSSSGNKVIETIGSIQSISTFDSNGVLSKFEGKVSGTVMYVLSRGGGSSSGIPGYDLPLLIGLAAITSVGIIYILKKKMLK